MGGYRLLTLGLQGKPNLSLLVSVTDKDKQKPFNFPRGIGKRGDFPKRADALSDWR
jgi:hypothetical protein